MRWGIAVVSANVVTVMRDMTCALPWIAAALARSCMRAQAVGCWGSLWRRSSARRRNRADACVRSASNDGQWASTSRPRWWDVVCRPSTRCRGRMKAACMARIWAGFGFQNAHAYRQRART